MITEKYVKIGERGQVVIPKVMRDMLHLKHSQTLRIKNIGNELVMRSLSEEKNPEDVALIALTKAKLTEKDWEEIQRDREER